mgnify:CR=1 FL=1
MEGLLSAPEAGLDARDLTLSHDGRAVVHDAGIDLRPGRVTALVGPNGSGKSTLLRALARLHPVGTGTVRLDGEPVTRALSARDFARRVTMLAQSRPTPGGVTVREVVGYGRHPHRDRWSGRDPEGAEAVERALAATGTVEMADRGIEDLSGGERQRVWLALCLAQQTDVLLLDEPTTYLDLRYQVEILDLARDLAAQRRVALGIVLHDLQQAADVADHLVLLDHGRVVAEGGPVDVLTADRLTEVYGCRIEVEPAADGGLTIRALGRHRRAR